MREWNDNCLNSPKHELMKTEKKSPAKKSERSAEPKNVRENRENQKTGSEKGPSNARKRSSGSRGPYDGSQRSDS